MIIIYKFVIVLITKTIKAMETAKEALKEVVKKAQKPSASGNLRSLTNSIKNLKKIELVEDKDKKTLDEIVKRVTDKWIENGMK